MSLKRHRPVTSLSTRSRVNHRPGQLPPLQTAVSEDSNALMNELIAIASGGPDSANLTDGNFTHSPHPISASSHNAEHPPDRSIPTANTQYLTQVESVLLQPRQNSTASVVDPSYEPGVNSTQYPQYEYTRGQERVFYGPPISLEQYGNLPEFSPYHSYPLPGDGTILMPTPEGQYTFQPYTPAGNPESNPGAYPPETYNPYPQMIAVGYPYMTDASGGYIYPPEQFAPSLYPYAYYGPNYPPDESYYDGRITSESEPSGGSQQHQQQQLQQQQQQQQQQQSQQQQQPPKPPNPLQSDENGSKITSTTLNNTSSSSKTGFVGTRIGSTITPITTRTNRDDSDDDWLESPGFHPSKTLPLPLPSENPVLTESIATPPPASETVTVGPRHTTNNGDEDWLSGSPGWQPSGGGREDDSREWRSESDGSPGWQPNYTAKKQAEVSTENQLPEDFVPHLNLPLPKQTAPQCDPALLSTLGYWFYKEIVAHCLMRDLYCTLEYPLSFTGSEAVDVMRKLHPTGFPEEFILNSLKSLIKAKVFRAVPEYSTKRKEVINSISEIYTFDEENSDNFGYSHGIYKNASILEEELPHIPQTVCVWSSPCYSWSCRAGLSGPCYAISCPTRYKLESEALSEGSDLGRKTSVSSNSSSSEISYQSSWSESVPRETRETLSKDEIKRQEAIYELTYTEENYVRDLEILDEIFAKNIWNSTAIDIERRDKFVREVLSNHKELHKLHRAFSQALRKRQEKMIVDYIGDILTDHLGRLQAVYLIYGPNVPLAEGKINQEKASNPEFAALIQSCEKQPETQRHYFRHFLMSPITRMQRYPLLLDAILKRTPEDHWDYTMIRSCIDTVRGICVAMDEKTKETRDRVKFRQIQDGLKFKSENDVVDLCLGQQGRELIHEGRLKKRSAMGLEMLELTCFLFDHCLLMTKMRKTRNQVEYRVSRRPIPIELLAFSHSEGISPKRETSAFSIFSHGSTTNVPSGGGADSGPLTDKHGPYSFNIVHLGRHGATYTFYANSTIERRVWLEKLSLALQKHRERRAGQEPFIANPLQTSAISGRITCSAAFTRGDGTQSVVVGTSGGVWESFISGGEVRFQQVLSIQNITQMEILEKERAFIVLADKFLYAFSLDALFADPYRRSGIPVPREPQKLDKNVNFFQVGYWVDDLIIISVRRKSSESNFLVLEYIGNCNQPLTDKVNWFRATRNFQINGEASRIQFLRSRIAIACKREFSLVNLDHLGHNRQLPDVKDQQFSFVANSDSSLKPLGMFRYGGMYLLCYNAFCFFVDDHGRFAQNSVRFEWVGLPDDIYLYDHYVIGFDENFIEIRSVQTGELVQIIPGKGMRCLYSSTNFFSGELMLFACCDQPGATDRVFQLKMNPL
ncbi:uncharacterized protein VTP21DRAFT_4214 [Calcarisporiella thermophila]|uniref:uncharacterized protein n=1 Tax=Calcarisporiella thermophila TaxID=911321 RepID=UPI003743A8AB